YWVKPHWVREMRTLQKIGVHTFYRPRKWEEDERVATGGGASAANCAGPTAPIATDRAGSRRATDADPTGRFHHRAAGPGGRAARADEPPTGLHSAEDRTNLPRPVRATAAGRDRARRPSARVPRRGRARPDGSRKY